MHECSMIVRAQVSSLLLLLTRVAISVITSMSNWYEGGRRPSAGWLVPISSPCVSIIKLACAIK